MSYSLRQKLLAGLVTGLGSGCLAAAAAPTVKPKPQAAQPKRMMVPPPPPEIPLIGVGSDEHILSTLGVPLEYMSKAELENMQTRLLARQTKLKKQVEEREQSFKDRRERATSFEALFKEGVVSRRELEAARKELSEMEENGNDLSTGLKDVDTDLQRVKKRLEALEKKGAGKNVDSPRTKKEIAKKAH